MQMFARVAIGAVALGIEQVSIFALQTLECMLLTAGPSAILPLINLEVVKYISTKAGERNVKANQEATYFLPPLPPSDLSKTLFAPLTLPVFQFSTPLSSCQNTTSRCSAASSLASSLSSSINPSYNCGNFPSPEVAFTKEYVRVNMLQFLLEVASLYFNPHSICDLLPRGSRLRRDIYIATEAGKILRRLRDHSEWSPVICQELFPVAHAAMAAVGGGEVTVMITAQRDVKEKDVEADLITLGEHVSSAPDQVARARLLTAASIALEGVWYSHIRVGCMLSGWARKSVFRIVHVDREVGEFCSAEQHMDWQDRTAEHSDRYSDRLGKAKDVEWTDTIDVFASPHVAHEFRVDMYWVDQCKKQGAKKEKENDSSSKSEEGLEVTEAIGLEEKKRNFMTKEKKEKGKEEREEGKEEGKEEEEEGEEEEEEEKEKKEEKEISGTIERDARSLFSQCMSLLTKLLEKSTVKWTADEGMQALVYLRLLKHAVDERAYLLPSASHPLWTLLLRLAIEYVHYDGDPVCFTQSLEALRRLQIEEEDGNTLAMNTKLSGTL